MPIWTGLTLGAMGSAAKAALGLVAISALVIALVLPRMQLRAEREAHEATKRQHAEALVQLERQAAQRFAEQQNLVDSARQELEDARQNIQARDAAIARANSDARGLRKQLASFIATPRPDDTPASCAERAAGVGELAAEGVELLGEGRELLRACARAHDERAAEVRALLRAWPQQQGD